MKTGGLASLFMYGGERHFGSFGRGLIDGSLPSLRTLFYSSCITSIISPVFAWMVIVPLFLDGVSANLSVKENETTHLPFTYWA